MFTGQEAIEVLIWAVLVYTFLIVIRNVMRYNRLKWYRRKLFPFRLSDMPVKSCLTREEHYSKIIKLSPKIPSCAEMIYLLKYKKFVDSPDVHSMCDVKEVDQMEYLVKDVIRRQIPGSIVETGSWRCGLMKYTKAIVDIYEGSNRQIYMFDTFDHFPKPTQNQKDQAIHPIVEFLFENMQPLDRIKASFKELGLLDDNVHFIQGLFEDTVPRTNLDKIAILRLDSDYYESTMLVLKHYYKNIVPGGWLVCDDYNNPFLGAKSAVTDFRAANNITSPIIDTHGGSVYWRV